MKERVYIMGKVGDLSDDDYYNFVYQKFAVRERALIKMGFEVINPMHIVPRSAGWNDAMKICIPEMLACDKISPLPDTWYSAGAMIEFELSQKLKMPIVLPRTEEKNDYEDKNSKGQ
jgi:hypothetical protein